MLIETNGYPDCFAPSGCSFTCRLTGLEFFMAKVTDESATFAAKLSRNRIFYISRTEWIKTITRQPICTSPKPCCQLDKVQKAVHIYIIYVTDVEIPCTGTGMYQTSLSPIWRTKLNQSRSNFFSVLFEFMKTSIMASHTETHSENMMSNLMLVNLNLKWA